MGWTRSRRYANYASGTKYDDPGNVRPQDKGSEMSEKAQSAAIFLNITKKLRIRQPTLRVRMPGKSAKIQQGNFLI